MDKAPTRLFWIEAALGSLTLALAILTPVFPDWIEFVSGWDPDQHDGSVESWVVIGLFAATVVIFGLALMEWRRAPASSSLGSSRSPAPRRSGDSSGGIPF